LTERFGEDAAGLLADLESAGIDTKDFAVFGHAPAEPLPDFDSARATTVLLNWLPRARTPALKEAIARSVTAEPAARGAGARVLVDEFRKAPRTDEWSSAKWAFANALETLADEAVADDLIELLRDPRHGRSRQMLCEALRRTKDPRAADVLIDLIRDPDVSGHAIHALRSYGPKSSLPHLRQARPQLEQVLADPRSSDFARRMARKSLERVGAVT
jgi:HEAT repeat protein